MKIEPYLSCDIKPNQNPVFSLRFSDENSCFDLLELSEQELREILKDIEDQIDLYLETNARIQASVESDKLRIDTPNQTNISEVKE